MTEASGANVLTPVLKPVAVPSVEVPAIRIQKVAEPRSGFFAGLLDAFSLAFKPTLKDPPAKGGSNAELRKSFQNEPSFTNHLPFRDFDAEHGVFTFDDGVNCGALFELTPVPTEARSDDEHLRIMEALWMTVKDSIPEDPDAPWVMQAYAQNQDSLHQVMRGFEASIQKSKPELFQTEYTPYWLGQMDDHLRQVSDRKGIFLDASANNQPWRGKAMRVRIALYRVARYPGGFEEAARVCNDVALSFVGALKQADIVPRRCTATDLYEWLLPWLSPRPASADGNAYDYVHEAPIVDSARPETLGDQIESLARKRAARNRPAGCISDEDRSPPSVLRGSDVIAGYDLGDSIVTGQVRSDIPNGCWWFDGQPHRVLSLQELTKPPAYGHLTGEREIGKATTTLLDLMPDGTTVVVTVVFRAQYQIQDQLSRIEMASKARRAESDMTREECSIAKTEIARGNKLYPVEVSAYLRGASLEELNVRTKEVTALMRTHGLRMIEASADVWPVHKYLQHLPFCYRYAIDAAKTNRSRLFYATQIARLLPVYGRATGTGKPGLMFFNRGAEPILFDPIRDRRKNAHGLLFGPSGSGKSAFLNNFAMNMMAVHRPRLFILDPSQSFGPLGEFFASKGLSVNYLQIGKPGITFNPFADALELAATVAGAELDPERGVLDTPSSDADDDEDIRRDLLGEMELKTLTMITGGERNELDRLDRGTRSKIRRVILDAIETVAEENRQSSRPRQVIVTDVKNAMFAMAAADKDERLSGMAHSLSYFTGQESLAGRIFDSQGCSLPEVDVTIVEFGIFAQQGRDAELILSTMTVLDRILYIAQKYQNQSRPIMVLHDEVHIPLKKPILAPYVVSVVKLWRKLGAWYWAATQDFEDVSDTAKPLMSNLEWMVTLQLSESEVTELSRFRHISAEDRKLLCAPIKQIDGMTGIGDYAEGVVLRHPDIRLLFRAVMPPLALALAGTEQEEKAYRARLMREHNLPTMLAANEMLADRIRQHRDTATQRKRKKWEA